MFPLVALDALDLDRRSGSLLGLARLVGFGFCGLFLGVFFGTLLGVDAEGAEACGDGVCVWREGVSRKELRRIMKGKEEEGREGG